MFPPGEAVGGRAAYIAGGLGGIQSLVAAVVTAATNDGAALVFGAPQGTAAADRHQSVLDQR